MDRKKDVHLYSLDAIRGVAALVVVLSHYKTFFYTDEGLVIDNARQPFYALLAPFYDWGGIAVDLFFVLSGFIFYWLYSESIASGKIAVGRFSLLRFSRLYPLHLVTLLAMAAIPYLLPIPAPLTEHNTVGRFVLHLFFATNWVGYIAGFNGPVWSVSVEVMLYALFFAMCRAGLVRWWALCIPLTAGWLLGYTYQGRGLYWFFLGGLLVGVWRWLENQKLPRWGVASGLCAAWVIPPAWLYCRDLYSTFGRDGIPFVARLIAAPSFSLVFFPLLILTAVLVERRFFSAKALAPLGNISYSAYLLHAPLQYVILGTVALLGIDSAVFYSPWMLLLLFALLIPAAFASYHFLELPAQRFLRSYPSVKAVTLSVPTVSEATGSSSPGSSPLTNR